MMGTVVLEIYRYTNLMQVQYKSIVAELGKDLNVNRIDFVVTSWNQRFMSEIIKLVTSTDENQAFYQIKSGYDQFTGW